MGEPRITSATLGIFGVLLEDAGQPRYGLEIAKAANLSHTTIYDTLARLETAGWLTSDWEKTDPRAEKRPRRRLYRLTALGEETAAGAVENQLRLLRRRRASGPTLRPHPAR